MTTEQVARPAGGAATRGRARPSTEHVAAEAPLDEVESLSSEVVGVRVTPLEWVLYATFTLVGAIMRFWDLGSRALHHDESLHATYSWYLWQKLTGASPGAEYHYDPMMHGPYQFHGNALMYLIFGVNNASVRMNAALCGTALIILPILLRRQLGRVSALILAGLLAFSPAFLYYSRFSREDIYFALWTAIFFVGVIRWLDARGREKGHRWLYMAAAGFALSWATKESTYFTIIIALGYILGIFVVAYAYQFLAPPRPQGSKRGAVYENAFVAALGQFSRANLPPLLAALRGTPLRAWAICLGIMAVITYMLFLPIGDPWQWGLIPGFHTQMTANAQNVQVPYNTDFLTGGLSYWNLQQDVSRGGQPWYYYFLVIPLYEQVAVVFGSAGLAYFLLRKRTLGSLLAGAAFVVVTLLVLFGGQLMPQSSLSAMSRWEELGALVVILSFIPVLLVRPRSPVLNLVLWWTVVTWVLYTYAGEKMPWLTLHMLLPLFFVAALYAGRLLQAPRLSRKWVVTVALLAVTALISLRSSVALAYVDGANPTEMLIYTQTSPDVPMVSDVIHKIPLMPVLTTPSSKARVMVDGADSWPWVWYLHDDPSNHGWQGSDTDLATASQQAITAAQERYPVDIVGWEDHNDMLAKGKLGALANYTAYEFKLRWWFPEEGYKGWETTGLGGFLGDALRPQSWANLVNWWATRTPFIPDDFKTWANAYRFFVYVRSDLVKQYVPASWASAHQKALADSAGPQATQADDVPTALARPITPLLTVNGATLTPPMSSIRDAAVDAAGDIYLLDSAAMRVVKLNSAGHYLASWGSAGTGPGQFSSLNGGPMGIAVAPNGHVYVTDTWNHRVQEFTADGTFVNAFGVPNPNNLATDSSFYGPRQLAVAPNGNIYVADTGNERIQVYSARGVHLFNIGAGSHNLETALGRFDEPSGVAVDKNGIVYVADYWDKRIQRFSLGGKPLGAYAVKGWSSGDYGEPYLAVDNQGHLFATDAPASSGMHVNHVLELNAATGAIVRAFGTSSSPLLGPSGVAAGPDHALYIADTVAVKLYKVQP